MLGLGSDLGARALWMPVLPHTGAAARMPEAFPSALTPVFAQCEHAGKGEQPALGRSRGLCSRVVRVPLRSSLRLAPLTSEPRG